MEHLKGLFCFPRRGRQNRHNPPLQDYMLQDHLLPHRPPQDGAMLLQMPVEIILDIVAYLPRQSLYTLAQSCRALQTILRCQCQLEAFDLPPRRDQTQSLDLFNCLSKDLQDRLFCRRCINFHAEEFRKFPRGQWREYQLSSMMTGCRRQKECQLQCCHPPHLCSCHRRRSMPYVQKQHIELVLTYRYPLQSSFFGINDTIMSPQRHYASRKCRLLWKSTLSLPSTEFHYKIMSRVVKGRFLLYREIRWTNAGMNGLDGQNSPELLHFIVCPAVRYQIQLPYPRWALLRPTGYITFENEYGWAIKCPFCMSEYTHGGLRNAGIIRLWQDLGSEREPRHDCCVDMVKDRHKAQREAGKISKLFGPV